jgi:hypothetical protein
MFTFIGAIWLRRFQPTLWEPVPVSHSLIRGQDEPAQQPNQLGEGNAVANAAKLMGTDNAVLSDSSQLQVLAMAPAHPSVTWLRCVHQFSTHDSVNSFAVSEI